MKEIIINSLGITMKSINREVHWLDRRVEALINNPSSFNDPRDIMNKKLLVIFTFYASFGDRINVNHLRSNKLH